MLNAGVQVGQVNHLVIIRILNIMMTLKMTKMVIVVTPMMMMMMIHLKKRQVPQ